VKFILEEGMKAQRGSRGLSLTLVLCRGGQSHALVALPPLGRLGTHGTGGWVGPRASLDGCRKSCPHWGL